MKKHIGVMLVWFMAVGTIFGGKAMGGIFTIKNQILAEDYVILDGVKGKGAVSRHQYRHRRPVCREKYLVGRGRGQDVH